MTDPRDRIREHPEAVPPCILSPEANHPVRLFEGQLRLDCTAGSYALSGTLEVAWLPVPEVRFEASGDVEWQSPPRDCRLTAGDLITSAPCIVSGVSHKTDEVSLARGFLSQSVVYGNPGPSLDAVEFALSNFHLYHGAPLRPLGSDSETWDGRRSFNMDPWVVTIDAESGSRELLRTLALKGGYVVAHSGRLELQDGGQFSGEDAELPLDALHYLFGFKRGFWVGPIMPTGRSTQPDPWRKVGIPILTQWRSTRSWYPCLAACDFDAAATKFYELWCDEDWRTPLRHAVWWYVEANGPAASETGLIMAHTALELLGWVVLVESAGALSADGFDRLPSSDKIRSLLGHLGIPLGIPHRLENLEAYAKEVGEPDGPGVVARMRNAVIHPSLKKRRLMERASREAKHDAKDLAIRMLELVILAVLGYDGTYCDRTHRGVYAAEAEVRVPWADQ